MPDRVLEAQFNITGTLLPSMQMIMDLKERIASVTTVNLAAVNQASGVLSAVQAQVQSLPSVVNISVAAGGNVALNQIKASTSGVDQAMKNVSNSTKAVTDTVTQAGSSTKGFFAQMQEGASQVAESVGKVKELFAALAIQGAIGGLSYLDAIKDKAYETTVYTKLEAKNIDTGPIKKFVEDAIDTGYTTASERVHGVNYLTSRTKLKGADLTKTITGAENFYATNAVAQEAFGSSQEMLQVASQPKIFGAGMKRELDDIFGKGFSNKSVTARLKIIRTKSPDDEKVQKYLEDHPEVKMKFNLSNLKDGIGQSLINPMNTLLTPVANFVGWLNKIPEAKGLLGWGLMAGTAVTGFALIASVIPNVTSGLGIMKAAMLGQNAVAATTATANAALAASEGVVATANMGVAASAYAMASGLWATYAPIALIALPLVALGAILYAVETKTHIFRKALKEIAHTQMAKDLLAWFKDVGYWINQGIKWIDNLYKGFKSAGGFKMVLDVVGAATMPLLRPMLELVDFVYKLIGGQDTLNAAFEFGLSLWKKANDFLSWVLEGIRSLISWASDFLTGIYNMLPDWIRPTKSLVGESKEGTIPREIQVSSGVYTGTDKDVQYALQKYGGQTIPYKTYAEDDALQRAMSVKPDFFRRMDEYKPTESQYKHLEDKGFVTWKQPENPFGGLAKEIANAIGDSLGVKVEIPYMDQLVSTLDELRGWLEKQGVSIENTKKTVNNAVNTVTPALAFGPVGGAYIGMAKNTYDTINSLFPKSSEEEPHKKTRSARMDELLKMGVSQRDAEAYATSEGYAVGATFTKGGLFTGRVHKEELLPEATTVKGPGTISKALDVLDNKTSYRAAGGNTTIVINAPFHVDKISSEVDMKKAFAAFRREMERAVPKLAINAVRGDICQRRT
jgi:hypothetical protein